MPQIKLWLYKAEILVDMCWPYCIPYILLFILFWLCWRENICGYVEYFIDNVFKMLKNLQNCRTSVNNKHAVEKIKSNEKYTLQGGNGNAKHSSQVNIRREQSVKK
jgi:hypothetical protein